MAVMRYLMKGGATGFRIRPCTISTHEVEIGAPQSVAKARSMAVGARQLGILGSLLLLAACAGAQVTCAARADGEWPAHCKPTQRDCVRGDRADLVSFRGVSRQCL